MPETEQRNINPAALPDFHTSSGDNVMFFRLLGALLLANHSFRIMWSPEKGRTDIEEGVDVEVVVPTRVRLQ
jgi:hypothetical protein